MPCYVAYYRKKLLILHKREASLRRRLARGESQTKLLLAAEMVREARIRALRARHARLPPEERPDLHLEFQKIEDQINVVRATSAEEILDEFRTSAPRARTY